MRAEGSAGADTARSPDVSGKRYLGAMMVVARSARSREYAVVYVSSGSFFRTDRLGALAVRALIGGRSDVEAMQMVERIEAGAGERARRLIDVFDDWSAMTSAPPSAIRMMRLRRLVAISTGWALGVAAPLVKVMPTTLLARLCGTMPLVDRYIWKSTRLAVQHNLRESGYARGTVAELLAVSRLCTAAPPRNYAFMYLGIALPSDRLKRVVGRLFDRESVDILAARVEAARGVVWRFLHGRAERGRPNRLSG